MFSSRTSCSPLGLGQSLGDEMCSVCHCGWLVGQPETSASFWQLSPQLGSLGGPTSHPAATIPLRSKSSGRGRGTAQAVAGCLLVAPLPGSGIREQGGGSPWVMVGVTQVPQRACSFLVSGWTTTGQRTGDWISEEGTASSSFRSPRRKCSHGELGRALSR